MNIVMISDQFPPITGGAERQAAHLCAALAARGHKVRALTGRWQRSVPASEERDGYTIERLPTLYSFGGIRGLRRYGQDVFAIGLRRRLRELAPSADVFHSIFVRWASAVTIEVGQKTGVPVLVKETTSGAKRSFQGIESLHHGKWMRERFIHDMRHVAVMNERAVQDYGELPFDDLVVHQAFNGIEEGAEVPTWDPVQPPELLFLGRIRPEKGAMELLEAFARIQDEFPDWRLRYCGDGPGLTPLRSRIATLGLQKRVAAEGSTTRPLQWLARATLSILPSYAEGMSNTLLEAMLVGTPSVVTRVGANEAVLGTDGGWLADSPRCDDLVPPLRNAMQSGMLRLERSQRARARVREHYSMSASARRYEEIYAEMGAAP